jgi:hypothetical protein
MPAPECPILIDGDSAVQEPKLVSTSDHCDVQGGELSCDKEKTEFEDDEDSDEEASMEKEPAADDEGDEFELMDDEEVTEKVKEKRVEEEEGGKKDLKEADEEEDEEEEEQIMVEREETAKGDEGDEGEGDVEEEQEESVEVQEQNGMCKSAEDDNYFSSMLLSLSSGAARPLPGSAVPPAFIQGQTQEEKDELDDEEEVEEEEGEGVGDLKNTSGVERGRPSSTVNNNYFTTSDVSAFWGSCELTARLGGTSTSRAKVCCYKHLEMLGSGGDRVILHAGDKVLLTVAGGDVLCHLIAFLAQGSSRSHKLVTNVEV